MVAIRMHHGGEMDSTRPRRIALAALAGAVLAPAAGWAAYASAAWLRFGRTHGDSRSDPMMDRYMPRYDVAELHRMRVAAPAAVTLEAARWVDLRSSRIADSLFRGRELLTRAAPPARAEHVPFVRELVSLGWGVLDVVPGRQLVLGAITRPWEANVTFHSVLPPDFAGFDGEGYVKIAVTIAADPIDIDNSVVRTETRAVATDPASRAKFRRYWSVFSPGIMLIRREAVALIREEAEARFEQRRAMGVGA